MNPVTLMSFRSEMQRIAYASLADDLEKTAFSPRKVLAILAEEGVEGIARLARTPEGEIAITRSLVRAPDAATRRALIRGKVQGMAPMPKVDTTGLSADEAARAAMEKLIKEQGLRGRMAPAVVSAATKADKISPKIVDVAVPAARKAEELGYRAANTTMAVAANPGVQSLMRNPSSLANVFADASSASSLVDAASGLADIVPDIAKMVKSAPKTVKPSTGIQAVKPTTGFKPPRPSASMKPASPAKPLKIKPVVAPKMKLPVPSSSTPAVPSF